MTSRRTVRELLAPLIMSQVGAKPSTPGVELGLVFYLLFGNKRKAKRKPEKPSLDILRFIRIIKALKAINQARYVFLSGLKDV